MNARVELWPQVSDFLRTLAPEPRKALRLALRDLERGKGDVKALEGKLEGFHRLRSGSMRVVFRYQSRKGRLVAECFFAERRSVVYELVEAVIRIPPD